MHQIRWIIYYIKLYQVNYESFPDNAEHLLRFYLMTAISSSPVCPCFPLRFGSKAKSTILYTLASFPGCSKPDKQYHKEGRLQKQNYLLSFLSSAQKCFSYLRAINESKRLQQSTGRQTKSDSVLHSCGAFLPFPKTRLPTRSHKRARTFAHQAPGSARCLAQGRSGMWSTLR